MTTVKTKILHWATKTKHFAKNNLSVISLIFSILALAISGYSFYLIKYKTLALPGTVATPKITNKDITNIINSGVPVMGDMNAKVTVIEFGDFQCPYCGKFFRETYPILKKEYIDTGKVRFVYVDFAFLGQESNDAAEAAKCAGEQNKFWEYYSELYRNQKGENQGYLNPINFNKFASNINLDISSFDSCIKDDRYDKTIADEKSLGRKFGVRSTPEFIVGDKIIRGAQPIENFRTLINL